MRSVMERALASAVLAATLAAGPAVAQVTPTAESRQDATRKAKAAQDVTTRGETGSDASEGDLKALDSAPRFPQDLWNWTPRSFEEEQRFPSEK